VTGITIKLAAELEEGVGELCEICLEKPAARACELCGRRVCEEHWREGRCEACEIALCQVCRSRLSVGYCAACGRLVCEDCSVEVGAARLCRECAAGFKPGGPRTSRRGGPASSRS
jgi:hypothetical protein